MTTINNIFSGTHPGMDFRLSLKASKYAIPFAQKFQERFQERKIRNQAKPRVIASWQFYIPRNLPEITLSSKALEAAAVLYIPNNITLLLPETHYWKKPRKTADSGFLKFLYIIYMCGYGYIIRTHNLEVNFYCLPKLFSKWRAA